LITCWSEYNISVQDFSSQNLANCLNRLNYEIRKGGILRNFLAHSLPALRIKIFQIHLILTKNLEACMHVQNIFQNSFVKGKKNSFGNTNLIVTRTQPTYKSGVRRHRGYGGTKNKPIMGDQNTSHLHQSQSGTSIHQEGLRVGFIFIHICWTHKWKLTPKTKSVDPYTI